MSELGLEDRTTRLISGKRSWDELTPILRPYAKCVTAAIAYIGSQAVQHLPLLAGSSIVVDASEQTVRSGSTDPRVLLAWAKNGVKVYSLAGLHAKMILVDRTPAGDPSFVAVGSANASGASASRLYEGVLLTDNDETIDEVRAALVDWKTLAGGPMTRSRLDELAAVYAVDRPDEEPDSDDETGATADPEEEQLTIWPRPKFVYIAPIALQGNASEEAVHIQQDLAQKFAVSDGDADEDWFDINMFWWDEVNDPAYEPNWKYEEGAHVIVVNGPKSGRMTAGSKLTEPGRVVHTYTETEGTWSRTYYYMHTKLSDEVHTLAELKAALASIDVPLDYNSKYLRSRVVDALLGIWTDIEYVETS